MSNKTIITDTLILAKPPKATISIPSIPANWIAHSGVLPAGNGYRTRVQKVLHTVGGYHPFCIHTAYEYNGEWAYECGRYFKDEAAALAAFEKA